MQALIEKIQALKKELDAVILAHNYQRGEIQDIADFAGDSLGLARTAAKTDAEVIVFCGVHFMAETAAITCPDKRVLMPDPNAGCPMANMLTPRELENLKNEHPGAYVITYVNSTAAVKAGSDVCCTSSNAVEIMNKVPADREIIFVPDQSLGAYAARETGRTAHLHPGYCPTHHRIRARDIEEARKNHPGALVIVHPECTLDVIDMADEVGSTGQIIEFCKKSGNAKFIVGTEVGLLHTLGKNNPDKKFYPATELADCPNMKLVTLEKLLWCLEDGSGQVTVDPGVAEGAKRSIDRMLEWSS